MWIHPKLHQNYLDSAAYRAALKPYKGGGTIVQQHTPYKPFAMDFKPTLNVTRKVTFNGPDLPKDQYYAEIEDTLDVELPSEVKKNVGGTTIIEFEFSVLQEGAEPFNPAAGETALVLNLDFNEILDGAIILSSRTIFPQGGVTALIYAKVLGVFKPGLPKFQIKIRWNAVWVSGLVQDLKVSADVSMFLTFLYERIAVQLPVNAVADVATSAGFVVV